MNTVSKGWRTLRAALLRARQTREKKFVRGVDKREWSPFAYNRRIAASPHRRIAASPHRRIAQAARA